MKEKVALITGTSGDIGTVLAYQFAKKGYSIIIHYNMNEEKAKKVQEKISEFNVRTLLVKADISKEIEVKEMFTSIKSTFNTIDVLINNAAIELNSAFFDKTEESFNKVLATNVTGTFLVTKYASQLMFNNKGKIINITSNNGIDKYDSNTMEYDASKAAIISLTKNIAKELAPNILVNAIAPGWVNTTKNQKLDDELDHSFISSESDKILLKRFAEPEEIAALALFLASDEASYITGEVIRIDGGC